MGPSPKFDPFLLPYLRGLHINLPPVFSYLGYPSFDPRIHSNVPMGSILCFCGMVWTHVRGTAWNTRITRNASATGSNWTCSGPLAALNWNKKIEFGASPKWRCCRPIFHRCDWRCLFGRWDLRMLSFFGLLFFVLLLLLWVVLPKWGAAAGDSLVHVHRLKHVLGGKSMVVIYPPGEKKQPPRFKKSLRLLQSQESQAGFTFLRAWPASISGDGEAPTEAPEGLRFNRLESKESSGPTRRTPREPGEGRSKPCLRQSPRGSGPGDYGWWTEHLRICVEVASLMICSWIMLDQYGWVT